MSAEDKAEFLPYVLEDNGLARQSILDFIQFMPGLLRKTYGEVLAFIRATILPPADKFRATQALQDMVWDYRHETLGNFTKRILRAIKEKRGELPVTGVDLIDASGHFLRGLPEKYREDILRDPNVGESLQERLTKAERFYLIEKELQFSRNPPGAGTDTYGKEYLSTEVKETRDGKGQQSLSWEGRKPEGRRSSPHPSFAQHDAARRSLKDDYEGWLSGRNPTPEKSERTRNPSPRNAWSKPGGWTKKEEGTTSGPSAQTKTTSATQAPKESNFRGRTRSNSGNRSSSGERGEAKCFGCGKTGHMKPDCPQKDKECNYCHKPGHLAVVCFEKQKQDKLKKAAAIRILLDSTMDENEWFPSHEEDLVDPDSVTDQATNGTAKILGIWTDELDEMEDYLFHVRMITTATESETQEEDGEKERPVIPAVKNPFDDVPLECIPLAKTSSPSPLDTLSIEGIQVKVLLDTGASTSLVNIAFIRKLEAQYGKEWVEARTQTCRLNLQAVDGNQIPISRQIKLRLHTGRGH